MAGEPHQRRETEDTPHEPHADPNQVFETQYKYGPGTDELSVVIVTAIADVLDVPPDEVGPEISAAVNSDALERLFRPLPDGTQRDGHLTFFIHGFRVTVTGDGKIRIYDAED